MVQRIISSKSGKTSAAVENLYFFCTFIAVFKCTRVQVFLPLIAYTHSQVHGHIKTLTPEHN